MRHDPDSKTLAQASLAKIYGKNTRRKQPLNERRTKPSRVVPHERAVAGTMAFNVVRACRESEGLVRFIDAPDILESSRTRQGKPTTGVIAPFPRYELLKSPFPEFAFSPGGNLI